MSGRWLTDLADVVRAAGLEVDEIPGWRSRGRSPMRGVNAVVCHHTAGPAKGNYPSLRIVRDGRSDLPGPLCNLGLARDGTVLVVAAGRANHAGGYYAPGDHRNTTKAAYQNDLTIGIEAEATGVDPWPEVQLDAYARLCAALVDHYGLSVADVVGHKESCQPLGRKSDPNFDMNDFRRRVATANPQEDDMPGPADWTKEDWAAVKREIGPTAIAKAVWAYKLPGLDKVKVAASVLLNRANDALTAPKSGGQP